MPLATATRLGSCEVLGALSAGGMGEVYRARDSKFKRDVALKTLPDLFSSEPERRARFTREVPAAYDGRRTSAGSDTGRGGVVEEGLEVEETEIAGGGAMSPTSVGLPSC